MKAPKCRHIRRFPFDSSIEPLEVRIAPAAISHPLELSSLTGANGYKLNGAATGDEFGCSVSAAGDVNGDGFDDVIVGAVSADPGGPGKNDGASYVVFGKAAGFSAGFALSKLNGRTGFKITGAAENDRSGNSVSAAGDVNGDGFDDLLVCAFLSDTAGTNAGAAYVIFGKKSGFTATLNLASLDGTNGFVINGATEFDLLGQSAGAAGDVNKDGFDDVILGAKRADPDGAETGAAYVVFGKESFTSSMNLSSLEGNNGFRISGLAEYDRLGASVDGAGDVNGDGFDDVIVGAYNVNSGAGASYVIFGKADGFPASLSPATLNGSNGFVIRGAAAGDLCGRSVAGAGDVNGDGFDDVIVAASGADPHGESAGSCYVIFGKGTAFSASMNLASLAAADGFTINGVAAGDEAGGGNSGAGVSGAGDVNGDGFADLLIGAYRATANADYSGAAYVVYGKGSSFGTVLELSALDGSNGFRIDGAAADDGFGNAVSKAGDVNGDGFDDLIAGAYQADPHGGSSGAAYLIFGAGKVVTSRNGKSVTFTDTDGDRVTVTTSRGDFDPIDFKFGPAPGGGDQLDFIDIGGHADFIGANITITVKRLTGDGLVHIGAIDASGIPLGIVKVIGDLGEIDAGSTEIKATGLKSLFVKNLGTPENTTPLESRIVGALGALTTTGDMSSASVLATGAIGKVTIKGSLIGGSGLSGILSGGKLGKVAILGDVVSPSSDQPVTISALGKLGATKAADARAIAIISVGGNVENARILAGFEPSSLKDLNSDAGIGPVIVKGNWSASSIAAGVADSTGDGFGRNDTLISGDTTPTIFASIASILIKGTATGSAAGGDHFGITAQRVSKLKIGTTTHALTSAPNDILLDATNNDFHVVDFA